MTLPVEQRGGGALVVSPEGRTGRVWGLRRYRAEGRAISGGGQEGREELGWPRSESLHGAKRGDPAGYACPEERTTAPSVLRDGGAVLPGSGGGRAASAPRCLLGGVVSPLGDRFAPSPLRCAQRVPSAAAGTGEGRGAARCL